MRTSAIWAVALGLLLATAGPALAKDPVDPVEAVKALERACADPGGTWKERWKAYQDMKDALEAAKGERKEAAEAAYDAIRPQVAAVLQRTRLEPSGWIMGFIGAVLLWGGFAFHVGVARRHTRKKDG